MLTDFGRTGTAGLAGIANHRTRTRVLATDVAGPSLCGADVHEDGGAASDDVLFLDHCFSPLSRFVSSKVAMLILCPAIPLLASRIGIEAIADILSHLTVLGVSYRLAVVFSDLRILGLNREILGLKPLFRWRDRV
jgi:hypothetical protein